MRPGGRLDGRGGANEGELLPDLCEGVFFKVALHARGGIKHGLHLQSAGVRCPSELPKGNVWRIRCPVFDVPRLRNGGDNVAAASQGMALPPAGHNLFDGRQALDPILQGQNERLRPAPWLAHLQAALGLPSLASEHDHVGFPALLLIQVLRIQSRAEGSCGDLHIPADAGDSDPMLFQSCKCLCPHNVANLLPRDLRDPSAKVSPHAAASKNQPLQRWYV
mmetsp:Transcript_24507/g.56897  ORF Transcript_24507/g.56897 Transcript_24507/m.56897 type:complete len:221 (-) Transcript_24507:51-713(-)